MNNSASPRYRDKNLIQQMHHISNAIDKSGLRDAPISENEAAIYAELGDYYTAISIFESMIKSEDQKYNIYSLNYYRVLKVKYLLQQCTNSTTKTEKKKLLSEIDRHKNTAERVFLDNQSETNTIMFNSILKSYLMAYADCHKDKDGKLSEQETQKYIEILKQISKQYYDAYLLSEKDEESTDSHTLCAAIYTMSLQSNNIKTQKNKLSEMLHEDVDMYLHHLPNKLLSQRKKRFWDEIKLINILEAKLAFMSKNSKAEINEMVENIITNYRKLWKTGGSVRNVMAEVDQLDFMIISSTITNAYSPYLIQRLRDLRDFYLSIIDAYYEQSK